jgi:hypothetical protein
MKTCALNETDFPRIRRAWMGYWLPLPPGEGWGEGSLASDCRRNKIVTIVTTRHARHAAPFITPGLGRGGRSQADADVPRARSDSKLRYFNPRQLPLKFLVKRWIERPLRLTQPSNLRPDLSGKCGIDRIKNFDRFHIKVKRTANVIKLCLREPFNVGKHGARNDPPSILKQHNRSGLCPKSDLAKTVFTWRTAAPRQLHEEELLLDLLRTTAHKARLLLRVHG